MKKYWVEVKKDLYETYEVYANSEEEAVDSYMVTGIKIGEGTKLIQEVVFEK